MYARLTLAVAAALSLHTAIALAQTPPSQTAVPAVASTGEDELLLKNGGMIRGTIVSVEPDREVVIVVYGTGEQRRIPWADVDKVDRGKHTQRPTPEALPPPPAPPAHAAPPPPPPVAPRGEPASPPPGTPGIVKLHIEANKPNIGLYEVTASGVIVGMRGSASVVMARLACVAPCDKLIDGRAGQTFYFDGNDINTSGGFRLEGQTGRFVARVDAGSAGARTGGVWLTSAGATGILAGGLTLGIGAATDDGTPGNPGAAMVPIGGVALGVGAALLIPGIILIATTGTSFTLERSPMDTALFRF
ncbi:hypothetical protein [Chondromyces crocatus]|uniref:Uncharacterized protein n=1 Tax=Chondromyces crocatus TaxID=52 RepID=A0A0K1ET96_CHOCO|nr:hypothetical protein [Chondromyces crocatus]AKT44066.1 uncharacterized protein CMC5_083040 [Chondromyces crocatus]